MKLKIISDGTKTGTKLVDAESGEMIHGVSNITYKVSVGEHFPKATIELFDVPVDLEVMANINIANPWDNNSSPVQMKDVPVKISYENDKISTSFCKIKNGDNQPMGAVQNFIFEANPTDYSLNINQLAFPNIEEAQLNWLKKGE